MTRDARDMPLVWIDGETTGLDAHEDLLLEIAVVITDSELNELGSFEAVLHQDRNLAARMMDPEVLRMHTRSGLLADLAVTTSETSMELVERRLIEFIHAHDAAGAPAAGSNISFDRGFLAVAMPELNEQTLHYRSLDVSTVKEAARRFAPGVLASAPVKSKEHRALADVRESIAEFRHYVRAGLFRVAQWGDPTPEQIEAAYQAWLNFPHKRGPRNAEDAIRAALVAAADALFVAPALPVREDSSQSGDTDRNGGEDGPEHEWGGPPETVAADTAALIAGARTLAARKVEDSADAESLQIMVGLLCDQLEQGFGR